MVKGKANKTFKRSKKYEFNKSINYVKGKINFEFQVAVKNNSQGSSGEGYYFWDVDVSSTTASPLNVKQLLSASNEFSNYKNMYTYGKVNGILIESIPSACNASTINYKGPVQIQTSFTSTTSYNNALILNPFQYCKQYIKSYQTDYFNLNNNSDAEPLGFISLLTQPTTLTQGYCPIWTIRISVYMSFKKNNNV